MTFKLLECIHSGDPDGGHETGTGGVGEERVFGLDLENPWIVEAFVAVWLGLAAAILRLGCLAWAATLGVALAASLLDVAEAGRQAAEAHPVLVTLAVLVALAHLALVILAGSVLARTWQEQTSSFDELATTATPRWVAHPLQNVRGRQCG
ncbi:MAG TPA: hypothetical protein VFU88_19410 [Ktedonobacterales bacterium]|nr:hypothetical protein [Ktedonobacterales bacterium]